MHKFDVFFSDPQCIHSVKSFTKQWDSVDHHLYNINMKECIFNNYMSNELLSGKNLGKLTVSVSILLTMDFYINDL